MLNKKNRVEAMKKLERSINNYELKSGQLITNSELLYGKRIELKEKANMVWSFLNNMRNKPEDIEIEIKELKIEYERFERFVDDISQEIDTQLKQAAGGAGAGVVAGVGVAAFGPSAAMAIATTFGTASTGTAISSLGGAAATKAALAWLGGGALTAGGGGMAAGSGLLALSGPIGWTIGGSALLGASFWRNSKNKKVANEAREKDIEINAQIKVIDGTKIEIKELADLTSLNSKQLYESFNDVQIRVSEYGLDYQRIKNASDTALIKDLGSLINQARGSVELLNRPIGKES